MNAAAAPYRSVDRFAWYHARGKLGGDPVYRALIEHGVFGSGAPRVIDIGCGQALVASLLQQAGHMLREGRWPAAWPDEVSISSYIGVDLTARDVARAVAAIGSLEPRPTLICGDLRDAALSACDVVLILDVLHYVDWPTQEALLARVRDALQAGAEACPVNAAPTAARASPGRLLLRVGDTSKRLRYAMSQWVDQAVSRVRGHAVPPSSGRTLDGWRELLVGLGFSSVRSLPMNGALPFANTLLIADLRRLMEPSAI